MNIMEYVQWFIMDHMMTSLIPLSVCIVTTEFYLMLISEFPEIDIGKEHGVRERFLGLDVYRSEDIADIEILTEQEWESHAPITVI